MQLWARMLDHAAAKLGPAVSNYQVGASVLGTLSGAVGELATQPVPVLRNVSFQLFPPYAEAAFIERVRGLVQQDSKSFSGVFTSIRPTNSRVLKHSNEFRFV